jgi:hypothetical protein
MRIRLSISLLIVGAIVLTIILNQRPPWIPRNEEQEQSHIKFSLAQEDYLTFSDLQNSTCYRVVGSNPSDYPGEFFDVDINIYIYSIPVWFNTSIPLFDITNHDENDIELVVRVTKGSAKFQWVIMKFLHKETNAIASIIWDDSGDISFQGEWEALYNSIQDSRGTLRIPGRITMADQSVSLYSVSILLDENIISSDTQTLSWKFELMQKIVEKKSTSGFPLFPSIICLSVLVLLFRRKLRV